jgi:hypothetical protein
MSFSEKISKGKIRTLAGGCATEIWRDSPIMAIMIRLVIVILSVFNNCCIASAAE